MPKYYIEFEFTYSSCLLGGIVGFSIAYLEHTYNVFGLFNGKIKKKTCNNCNNYNNCLVEETIEPMPWIPNQKNINLTQGTVTQGTVTEL